MGINELFVVVADFSSNSGQESMLSRVGLMSLIVAAVVNDSMTMLVISNRA